MELLGRIQFGMGKYEPTYNAVFEPDILDIPILYKTEDRAKEEAERIALMHGHTVDWKID